MELDQKGIVFKGNSEGLVIVIPEDYSFTHALTEIESKVSAAARFFKGARIKVTYRGLSLTIQQEEAIRAVLDDKSGAIIESFSKDDEARQNAFATRSAQPNNIPTRKLFYAGVDEGNCKFVRSTIRSGTRIQYDGNVVIMGDVNPGGEIVASGNVVVLGTLRGMVHAGADGNRDAFIYALGLKPTQIRIAEVIARTPADLDEGKVFPEIATIKDGAIVVEQLEEAARYYRRVYF
ncbi:MAG: septum site-determining protein MinC [Clostridia bacterium]|nr:septum site-determining protein MinC [Clostridia bacterium]